jgi:hypothetical protein
MTSSIAVGFAVGMLVTVTAGALPVALAALGLGARDDLGGVGAATMRGAVAGGAFAATFMAAAGLDELGVDIAEIAPFVALAAAAALLLAAVRQLARDSTGASSRGRTATFGAVYALVALPGGLPLFEGLTHEAAKARGETAVVGVVVLVAAGMVAALIALSLLARLLAAGVRRLGAPGRVVPAALIATAAVIAAAYWLPAATGSLADRGGAPRDALTDVAGTIGVAMARYEFAFALLLFAASCALLAATSRR